ncbi:MAG: sigma-70 family RNA polymerase sigma factor [Phycisphaeraceae bacterium]|nr:sigma-70 family RNA polymerase sigma factor [Phycisphaeraceae bacterium]
MNSSDLSACVRGDSEAWKRLIDEVLPVVSAMVRKTLGPSGRDENRVADTVQEVFVRLIKDDFRLLRQFDPSRARLTTWMALVARSVALNELRRPSPLPLTKAMLDRQDSEVDPEPGPGDTESESILDAIPRDLLSPSQARVMELLYRRSFTVEEAAATLGVARQSVRSLHHKALEKLRGFFRARSND